MFIVPVLKRNNKNKAYVISETGILADLFYFRM